MARRKTLFLEKTVTTPRGPAASMTPLIQSYQTTLSVQYAGQPASSSLGINRGNGADWFGPLNPMAPIAPREVAGRQLDFNPGYNLVQTPRAYEPVGFAQLQALAQFYDILRLVIETRKDEMERLEWSIRPKEKKLRGRNAKLDPEIHARIDAVTKFFRKPDGFNRWGSWLRMLLEDLYVIDAPSLYCQRTRGGQLFALLPVDGATIKRVIDDWGRTPVPYIGLDGKQVMPPAYQQVLKGLPAVNYTVRDIIYRPRNVRSGKVYGFSPVEQILMTINIGLRREMWQLSYYSEGNIPEAFIGTPDGWTPQQIKDYQAYFDTYFTGDIGARRRAKFVPGAMAKNVTQTKDPEMMNVFDEWCARIVCFAFSLSPQAFVRMMNRSTGETAKNTAEEQGLQPSKQWVKSLIDGIIEDEFLSSDLEFVFDADTELDEAKRAEIADKKVSGGLLTINEGRADLGEQPSDDSAADTLMVKTATGFVPIDANTIEGKKAMLEAMPPPDPALGGFGKPAAGKGDGGKDGGDGKGKPDKAEKHAHSHAHGTARFNKSKRRVRRLAPVPIDRPDTRRAREHIRGIFVKLFKTIGPQVANQVLKALAKADETPEERAKRIADDLDLDKFKSVYDKVAAELGSVSGTAAEIALAQMGVEEGSDLYDKVNAKAVEFARERAAELLGMTVDENGDLVDNPDAQRSVTQGTRDRVRDIIASGLEENIGFDEIADQIEAEGFTQDRADMIARTEIANANSQASLDGYLTARDDAGVSVQKEWLLAANPCQICIDNAAEGPIDLDDPFPSGDDAPTAHPNCECALMPVVDDDGN